MSKKPKYAADLHCHSSASDGLLKPGEMVSLAAQNGLLGVAITDHDTIEGWREAELAAEEAGIILIKGVEINTDWKGKEVHILGFGMDENNIEFKSKLIEIQEKRVSRIKDILIKLNNVGMNVSFDEVSQYANGESMGRPHVAQAMVGKGYVESFKLAFNHYLRIGAPAYVPRYKLDPSQAIKIIRNAGGVTVLAHPGTQCLESEIPQWVEVGLQGIEANHPDHSFSEYTKYRKLSKKLGLLATGGSDFHGSSIKPGIDIGDWGVELDVVEQLRQMIKNI